MAENQLPELCSKSPVFVTQDAAPCFTMGCESCHWEQLRLSLPSPASLAKCHIPSQPPPLLSLPALCLLQSAPD